MISFGTDGWRGIIAEDFTFPKVRLVSKAIAMYLEREGLEKKIVMGYDSRFLSEKFAISAAQVLTNEGITVFIPHRDMPTPVIASSVLDLGASGAMMFTASHNPPEYNGLKFIPWYGGPATDDITCKIEENINQLEGKEIRASLNEEFLKFYDPLPAYFYRLNEVLGDFSTSAPLIYDPLYGTGRGVLDTFLKIRDFNLYLLHGNRDPLFGGLTPEPKEENLTDLLELSKSMNCLALTTDGDADRFTVAEGGRLYTPNEAITLIAYFFLEYLGLRGKLVRSLSTTTFLDRLASYYDVPLIETPVGFKFVGEEIRKGGVLLGGEESGGISVGWHLPEKDGILGCLLVLKMVAVTGKSLNQLFSELCARIPPVFNLRTDLHFLSENRPYLESIIKRDDLAGSFSREVDKERSVSGRQIVFVDGSSLLFRMSGTENVVRIYGEDSSRENLLALMEEGRNFFRREKS